MGVTNTSGQYLCELWSKLIPHSMHFNDPSYRFSDTIRFSDNFLQWPKVSTKSRVHCSNCFELLKKTLKRWTLESKICTFLPVSKKSNPEKNGLIHVYTMHLTWFTWKWLFSLSKKCQVTTQKSRAKNDLLDCTVMKMAIFLHTETRPWVWTFFAKQCIMTHLFYKNII